MMKQESIKTLSIIKIETIILFCILLGFGATAFGLENIRQVVLPGNIVLEMVKIKGGSFMMGSPEDEEGRSSNEVLHRVILTEDYWLGRFEVTQAQYEAVMNCNPSHSKQGKEYPVNCVSWEDAMAFCTRLTMLERKAGRLSEKFAFTLPTEAEWEYACRAGTTTALYKGTSLEFVKENYLDKSDHLNELGWYTSNSRYSLHPVGQKRPNAWGLYDMYGNVGEWCFDWFGSYSNHTLKNPMGPAKGIARVMRGGGIFTAAYACRSAQRFNCGDLDEPDPTMGFRLALATERPVTTTVAQTKQDHKKKNDSVHFQTVTENIELPEGEFLELVKIPTGSFEMGSADDELGRYWEESKHHVILTKDFWLGKYEVTQAQYEAIMNCNPSHFHVFKCFNAYPVESISWEKAMNFCRNYPVDSVSWEKAMEFCRKLTEYERNIGHLAEGYEFTLPTEAQWEYACRAGTTTALNNGENLKDKDICSNLDKLGWYRGNAGKAPHAVGQKSANAWGLFDMHGNLEEWCLDWANERYLFNDETDPMGPSIGKKRIQKGGCWAYNARNCRSASHAHSVADASNGGGFRVALVSSGITTSNIDSPFINHHIQDDKNLYLKNQKEDQFTFSGNVILPDGHALELLKINAGCFIRGSDLKEPGHLADESLERVQLTKDYWLGKYEVTQAQWKAVMGASLIEKVEKIFPGEGVNHIGNLDDDFPMYHVTWEEAMEFCRKLTEQERKLGHIPEQYVFMLPTESQWEYACRAGTKTALYNGPIEIFDDGTAPALDDIAWYSGNSSVGYTGRGWNTPLGTLAGPRKVGTKLPNAWGLYDMIGNIEEWCWDWDGYYNVEIRDPMGRSWGNERVLKGGSWASFARFCRSAAHTQLDPQKSNCFVGFRVALVYVGDMVLENNNLVPKKNVAKAKTPSINSNDRNILTNVMNSIFSGQAKLTNNVTLDMVKIKGGSFDMGCSVRELGQMIMGVQEEKLHRVTLTKDYWIGKTEVTQAQYEAIMDCNPSIFKLGGDYPVENVSWNEAMTFCQKLTEHEKARGCLPDKHIYTLPTEAQWEYACRAGTVSALNNMKNLTDTVQCPYLDGIGWYLSNSGNSTHPVGQKRGNKFGLNDMHGNVWEWCLDIFGYYKDNVTDPIGESSSINHSIRGGSWHEVAANCRSACRGYLHPQMRRYDLGFRVVLVPVQ